MRTSWLLCASTAALLTACEDKSGNHTVPDTALDEVPAALSNKGHVRITFVSLGNANGFICTLDGGSPSMCISPFEAEAADGEHTFEVAAALNQNVDETPATFTWRIDTVKPETELTSAPPALDNATSPSFEFTGSDAGVRADTLTFECALDGATFAACASPNPVTVGDGAHTFAVRAKDAAGNVDETPAMHTWTVDTTAPETAIIVGPVAGATTAATGSFEFSSPEPGATFECAFDGAAFTACTSPRAFSLPSGSHTFAVRAKDGVGTLDPSPAIRMWTVDATPPDVTLTATPTNPSNDPTAPFSFASSESGATFECRVDAAAFAACTTPLTTAALADGSHTFRVRSIDGVGNVSTTTATFTWTIDTAAPTVTLTAQPAPLSNDATPSVSFTTTGAPAVIQCQVDAGAFAACTSPFTSAALADGTHSITVRATDAAGNFGTDSASFMIDTAPPTVTITAAPAALSNDATPTVAFTTAGAPTTIQCRVDSGAFAACASPFTSAALADGAHTITVRAIDAATNTGSASASFTIDTAAPTVTLTAQPPPVSSDTTPTVSFTTTGAPTTIQCQVDGGAFANCTSPFTSAALGDGAHTITVRATDAATNSGSATASFTIDATGPTVTITSQPPPLSSDTTPTVAFTTTGSPTTIQCRVDTAAFAICTSPFTAAAQPDGDHTITVRATDAAGNPGTATTNTFTIDTVAPTVTITAQPAALSNDTTPTVAFTTAGAPVTIECRLDAGAFGSCTSPFTTTVTDGSHTIAIRATDAAGNPGTATTNAFVVDTAAPTVTITGQPPALSNDSTPTVAFTTAGSPTTITCQVDAATPVTCSSPFTTTVADGTHTITVRVVDGAGNPASASTSPFTVDTAPPTLTLDEVPPAQWPVNYFDVRFTAGGGATATECALNGGAFAACTSPHTITTSYGTASTLQVRARDGANNTVTRTASWTSSVGQILHYPWEQGSTQNTSLLAQVPSHSPDGTGALPASSVVGGWAGTAITSVGAHKYVDTVRALSSSPNTNYSVSFWYRIDGNGNGTIVNTIPGNNAAGFRVLVAGRSIELDVADSGQVFSSTTTVATGRWNHVGLRSTGAGKGLELFLNGLFQFQVAPPTGNGFGAGQLDSMEVGTISGELDVDDLQFYNRSFTNTEMCTVLGRGSINPNGACDVLAPGFELDFEHGTITDTGSWRPSFVGPTGTPQFLATKTGMGIQHTSAPRPWGPTGLLGFGLASTGSSIAMWFNATSASNATLFDESRQCVAGGPPTLCGVRISLTATRLDVLAGTSLANSTTASVPLASGMHSVLVTERRSGSTSQSVTVFVDGVAQATIPLGTSNIWEMGLGAAALVGVPNQLVDEIEIWPTDLTRDAQMLCENGFDGEFDLATGGCSLTSN